MQLSISTNFPDVRRQIDRMQADIAAQATARAVNRTVDIARTAMNREIRAEFNLPAGVVRDKLFVKRASFKGGLFNIEAQLLSRTANGKRRSLNLINFGARQAKGGGLSVLIKRSSGRKTIRGAFIGNKGRTVFARVGSKRLPIEPVQTIDVPQMFNTQRINRKVVAVLLDRFPQVFAREAKFYLDRFNATR